AADHRHLHSFPTRRSSDLVVQLLAAAQAKIELDATVAVMKVQRNQRIAALLGLADQFLDLFGVQQQLAGTGGFGADVRRGGGQRDRKSTRLNSSHVKISYA